ncbi:hypothetical protein ACYFX5_15845 [Bremerella sp. T1]|uniref:hypothetical protein n=1 Tax=Bremerella sp. TYQ1 TaxID=3119568 RepID=UPI001CCCB0B1|nr:hypothetical protein [Bremerella volcania]UBM34529.1 hypothetical protein LA756_17795 [Bremerella volcania]
MVFEHIEKLKREYTDKYVAIAHMVPELKRFAGRTGIVRTVNMSGRALVEFLGTSDISWYDIDIDYLKIVEKPPEPVAEKQSAKKAPPGNDAPKKPATAKKPQPKTGSSTADILAMARGKKPAESKPKKQSTSDILAAARGEKKSDKPKSDSKKPSTSDILAMARGKSEAKEEKKDEKSLSTADKLAMLRGEKKADTPANPPAQPTEKKKPSTADILAMARGKKTTETKKEESSSAKDKELTTAEKLALLRGEKKTEAAAVDKSSDEPTPKKPSTADILAMARGQKKKSVDDSSSGNASTEDKSEP